MAFTHNAGELVAAFRRRAVAVPRNLELAAEQGADELTKESVRIYNAEVEAIPEKMSRTGRKLWVRSHDVRDKERFVAVGLEIAHQNTSDHAEHRYNYPGRGRKARPPQRPSKWWADAARRKRLRILQLRAGAVLAGLRGE